MSDIVERLRSLRHIHVPQLSDEAADEIERLRLELSGVGKSNHPEKPDSSTLTDAEREAITACESDYSDNDMDAACWQIAATLRGLLSRTGSDSRQTCDEAAECRSRGEKLPERERLTDAEREAVERASVAYELLPTVGARQVSATLRGLLERLNK